MTVKKTTKLPHRRAREGRTDYRQRFRLLSSGKPRLVVRKSANNVMVQVVRHDPAGDRTVVTADARLLFQKGWKGHGGNLPAAYLVGFLCGTLAKQQGVTEAVADLGLYRSTKGSVLYAAVKGAVDAGLQVPHGADILPSQDRLLGRHIAQYASHLKQQDQKKYQLLFGGLLKKGLAPEQLPQHVEDLKKKLAP